MDEQLTFVLSLTRDLTTGAVKAQSIQINPDSMQFKSIEDSRSAELYLILTEGENHEG